MKLAVLLHGSGVYDGTEIQEAVLTLLAISKAGHSYECFAPDKNQLQVINHLTGEEMPETRNVLAESARIARGDIKSTALLDMDKFDGLVMPGGFGTAKNITTWAVEGSESSIDPNIKTIIINAVEMGKPIVALCMSPTTVAKALEGSTFHPTLSVGSTSGPSPYDIGGINSGMEKVGATTTPSTLDAIAIDKNLKIISAPCYMMEATILEVSQNIEQAISALDTL